MNGTLFRTAKFLAPSYDTEWSVGQVLSHLGSQAEIFELFLDAVQGKTGVPLVTPQEAAVRSAVMEALYQGARQNSWVNI